MSNESAVGVPVSPHSEPPPHPSGSSQSTGFECAASRVDHHRDVFFVEDDAVLVVVDVR